MEKILLHGTLHVTIYEAHGISGTSGDENIIVEAMEEAVEWIEDVLRLRRNEGKLFATIDIEGARVGRTRLIDQDKHSNPRWDEQFHIYVAHVASHIVFTLRQDEAIGSTPLGTAYLPVIDILNGDEIETWLDILDNNHKPIHHESKIHIKVKFIDVTKDVNWDQGLKSPEFPGVPLTFFPQRNQCRITLYQDSHVPNDFAPKIPLAYGMYYEPHRCWEDIFDAINNARHLIYIVGWSIYPEITLVRDIERRPKTDRDMTLGELLKKKAEQGVRVILLVWDNVTEKIKTHDEETREYFSNSQVYVELCPRFPDKGKTVVQDARAILGFTHHQKTVVVDSAMPGGGGGGKSSDNRRRIVSFVGGLDLCDGRYDTPSHSLFRTLNSIHHNDFHQPNFEDSSINKGGPREPWHDIHSRLEGQVAWDVLYNFEQRCKKYDLNDILVNLQEMGDIFIPPSQVTFPNDHQETWNVQVFRSIDGGDAFGFPESPEEAAKIGLVTGKDNVFDRSIQDAYIHAIRRAKRFIYIENQYFIGSSFDWKPEIGIDLAEIKALQLIPKELSLKIVSKIQKGERFTVYVVIPMWPEGVPEDYPTQAILDLQRRTMEMMYTDITLALRDKGIEANPKDYLSFFCLGNREVKRAGEYEPSEKPKPDTDYSLAQANRRFMIYVHAKMMIVDDEYIIVGSANLNQRSMDGARDSEIAMGGYQPQHIWHGDQLARGQVHGFRMSLWYEHMGMLDDVFLNPESLDCVRKVNKIADKYWDLYTSKSLDCDLPGQLLTYPIQISKNGEIEWPSGFENFPDTKAYILGQYIPWLPPFLTT